MVAIIQRIYNEVVFFLAKVRGCFWKLFLKKGGKNLQIMKCVRIGSPHGVVLGNNVNINHHTEMSGLGSLTIGNYVMIGPYCQIFTANHEYQDWKKPMREQGIVCGKVEIGDDVWLGANVIILPNVKIGRGAIIGANSVVTKDVEPFSLVAGAPAKHRKYRFSDEIMEKAKLLKFD